MERIFKRGNVERITCNDDVAKELENKKYEEITKKPEAKSNNRGTKKSNAKNDTGEEEE